MDRRARDVAARVRAAASDTTIPTLSEATDIPVADLMDRLEERVPFTMSELLNVGGFLHVRPQSFLVETAA